MCAIAGILNLDGGRPVDRNLLLRMRDSMIHRGPDDCGAHFEGPIGLAARRLSIVDLETGNQPIHNEDQTIWIVNNGEIYNFRTLRKDLESHGHRFYTQSDTEVLVHAYEEFGMEFLQYIHGMFAFALWDSREQRLLLARDRMGEKPLHYYAGPREFIFGSELKSILQHPAAPRSMDPSALSKYLTYQYVPAPQTIFRGVKKLQPGHLLTISARTKDFKLRQYWDIPIPDEPREMQPIDAAADEFLGRLRQSVRAQLASDVPMGVLMSGGLDSTLVAALASEVQPGIQAFTMAFDEPSYDESRLAKLVAERVGCRHHIEVCKEDAIVDAIPRIAAMLDEPMADASLLPTYLLSQFTAKHVKAVLGGDGGDELFGGYPTFQALEYRRLFLAMPQFLRRPILAAAAAIPSGHRYLSFGSRLKLFLRGIDPSAARSFFYWMGAFLAAEKDSLLLPSIRETIDDAVVFEDLEAGEPFDDDLQRCFYLCSKLYLQDGVLVKMDRAAMANSLEVRSPFLAPDMIEFAARCPTEYKVTLTQTKRVVRHAARSLLPADIVWGKKHGFGVPMGKWIQNGLKPLFQDHLNRSRIDRGGVFDGASVEQLLGDHLANRADNSRLLWTLLVFELWKERREPSPAQ